MGACASAPAAANESEESLPQKTDTKTQTREQCGPRVKRVDIVAEPRFHMSRNTSADCIQEERHQSAIHKLPDMQKDRNDKNTIINPKGEL
jgi:hypothetical protein